jgi:hypothetical protein
MRRFLAERVLLLVGCSDKGKDLYDTRVVRREAEQQATHRFFKFFASFAA